jgi:hypothetical protein
VAGGAVVDELADALVSGERRAGPDDDGAPVPGQILGPVQAIGVALGRTLRDSRNPRNTTTLVDTSDRLWIASPSSPTEPGMSAPAGLLACAVIHSCPPLGRGRRVQDREATRVSGLGLDSANSGKTMKQRGGRTTIPETRGVWGA